MLAVAAKSGMAKTHICLRQQDGRCRGPRCTRNRRNGADGSAQDNRRQIAYVFPSSNESGRFMADAEGRNNASLGSSCPQSSHRVDRRYSNSDHAAAAQLRCCDLSNCNRDHWLIAPFSVVTRFRKGTNRFRGGLIFNDRWNLVSLYSIVGSFSFKAEEACPLGARGSVVQRC